MIAIDTNIFVYAYDTRDPLKQARAAEIVSESTQSVRLWQVACEFLAVSRKLAPNGLTLEDAFGHLEDLRRLMPLFLPGPDVLDRAREIAALGRVQLWDAMLYAALSSSRCFATVVRRYSRCSD